jgi:quinol monooxygenase YgiN
VNSSKSDLIIIATVVAKPGRERELEQALREAAGPTRAQPGCIHFSLHRVKGNASTIIGFERWATEADHQRHIQGAHIQRLMGRTADILAEPPTITSYEVLDE